ncbi:four helix bundle protein [Hassallia byssoidea VB512170]|uniref:Four helix bundle protein n=1 Tax=Hassallia byssoidea VB512170 TaxID=1304833 RepID=A0A846HEC0_9CYAN|nr:four helix bundle protein [Hassalia byssoidea]NEU74950.1 four helix bundle protein [Hassalia byssoidea VB512170]
MVSSNNFVSINDRTKNFAIRIIKACSFLDDKPGVCRTLGKQLLRSGTSIGANVREAQSAESNADFIHKLQISLKECRETQYWIEILIESETVHLTKFNSLLQEANEIGKILVVSINKLKLKQKPKS